MTESEGGMVQDVADESYASKLIARCIVPVKPQFLRARPAEQPNSAPAPTLSKKAQKKSRDQVRNNTINLCYSFVQGTCTYGDKCKFSHDIEAYLAAKPDDLPGVCPFSAAAKCPYGLTCRYAGSHASADQLHERLRAFYAKAKQDKHASTKAAEEGADTPAGPPALSVEVETLPSLGPVLPLVNVLDRDTTGKLWKSKYDFGRADAVIKSLGCRISFKTNAPAKSNKASAAPAAATAVAAPPATAAAAADAPSAATAAAAPVPLALSQAGGTGGTGKGEVEADAGASESERAIKRARTGDGPGVDSQAGQAMDTDDVGGATATPGAVAMSSSIPASAADVAQPVVPGTSPSVPPADSSATVALVSISSTPTVVVGATNLYSYEADTAPGVLPNVNAVGSSNDATAAAAGAADSSTGATAAEKTGHTVDGAAGPGPSSSTAAADVGSVKADAGSVWRLQHVETRLRGCEKVQLDFRGKTYLAPLTTVGNLPFRRICKGLGVDITCGEMALATNLLQGQAQEWALLKRHPCEDLFGVQVCGGYADAMGRVAQLLDEFATVDFVDVNMGCPIDLICDKGAGSSLLNKPKRMEDIARSMSAVLAAPLTLKLRKGFLDNHDVAHTLIPQMRSWGASAVTLHGRTRQQRYSRAADWDYIESCAGLDKELQLVGNGDVFSYEDWNRHMAAGGGQLATCMVARGALIKPWIFTEIKEQRHWDISAGERLDLLKQFCAAGLEHWGCDSRGVETTRRFLLEWLSFTHRYVPVGLLDVVPQQMQWRPPAFCGRSDLETLLASEAPGDWVKISEMLLGRVPQGFTFAPKHKSNSYLAVTKPGDGGGGGGAAVVGLSEGDMAMDAFDDADEANG